MAIEVVTKEDLEIFRQQLLNDLKQIIQSNPQEQKEWLKSFEVRKLVLNSIRYRIRLFLLQLLLSRAVVRFT
jgi:hypothetical protein